MTLTERPYEIEYRQQTNKDNNQSYERSRLTQREEEVLLLAAKGMSYPKIGQHLGISRRTVSSHMVHAFATLESNNIAQAVFTKIEDGDIEPSAIVEETVLALIPTLTESEQRVLDTMTQNGGITAKSSQIAEVLYVSPRTVEEHFDNISSKLGIKGINRRIKAGVAFIVSRELGMVPESV